MIQNSIDYDHRYRTALALISLIAMLCMIPSFAFAQKTDVITFKNGDQLTVDIKQLDRGLLRASTVGMGTIQIEWEVIESIETNKTYQVELSSGEKYLGSVLA